MDLTETPTTELFATYGAVLRELRRREIVRTNNAPAGDWAEYLVARFYGVELERNSARSWDLRTRTGERIQIKTRVVFDPAVRGQRQLSPFRSWDFDTLAVVLLTDLHQVRQAALLPADAVRETGVWKRHVNGHVVFATDELMTSDAATDLTADLRDIAGGLG